MTVAKVVDLIGVSTNSWEDAVRNAVSDASETIDNITGVEVLNTTASVKDGEIREYRANVKVAFGLLDR